MRKLPIAVALSAAVHGAAIAWVQTRPRPKPEAPRAVTTVEIVAPPAPKPDDEPVAVALLDDHSVPAISGTAAGVSHATSGPHRGHGAISTGTGHGETPAGTLGHGEPSTGTGSHNPLMGMRGKSWQLGWNPSAAFDAAFAANEKPIDVPPPPSGELTPSGNGTYTTDHGMDGAFVGTVHSDGTVSIKDKPTVGDIHFAGLGVAGRANFDDWAMHQAGIDPYASAKRQWLDKTREERVRIGAAYRSEQLARAPEYMKRNLAWAWSRTASDPDARKQALFELWDDCAETGDDSLVAAGTAARLYVVGFIRAHLPQGTAGAFTSEELTRLNAKKRSSATFQPY